MESVSKKGARRKTAFSDDEKGLAAFRVEGYLEKRNKRGTWQKRWFYANNRYLNYSKGPDKPVIGSMNLTETETIELGERKGEFHLAFFDGSEYTLRCDTKAKDPHAPDVYRWLKCLEERKGYYENISRFSVEQRASLMEKNESPDQVGWLKKKSPGFREVWQERYVKLYIDTANMYYFKTANRGAKKAGAVALDNVEWCRPVDESAECREFEFLALQRVFRWRAETHEEMSEWISNIRSALNAAKDLETQQRELTKRANTPASVLKFDGLEDDEARKQDIDMEIEITFEACDGQDIACLEQAVDFATQDLVKLAEDCASKPGRESRNDILAFHLELYHQRIEKEIAPFLVDQRIQSTENTVLYAAIKLICKYAHDLGDFNARLPPKRRQKSSQLSELGRLSDRLVNGPNGTIRMVQTVCTNAAERQIKEGFKGAQMFEDGKYYTTTVIDVWESINMTVKLAEDTKSAALQYMVIDGAMTSFASMLATIGKDTREVGVGNGRGIEYVCAGMNDCTKHVENLNTLQYDLLSLDDVRDRIAPSIDHVMRQLGLCGDAGTEVLSRVVLQDLLGTIATLFTKAWKTNKDPVASTMVATVTDYLNDYSHVLVEYYNVKVAGGIFSRLVVAYVRKLRRQLYPTKADRVRGRYIKISDAFVEQFERDCSTFEDGLLAKIQIRDRPDAFEFLDELKVLFGGSALEVGAMTTKLAGILPLGDPRARIAVEQAIASIIKLRTDLKDVSSKKDFLSSLMGIVDQVVETKEETDRESQVFDGARVSRLRFYVEAFGKGIEEETEDNEAQNDDPFAMEGDDESAMEWMQHADDDIESKRVDNLAFMHQEATPLKRPSMLLQVGNAPLVNLPEKFMDGFLEKRNDNKIWSKRWFEFEQLHDASSGDGILLLSWSKNPGEKKLNSIVIDKSSTASIHHATENLVEDESTGECFLAKDYPSARTLKLTAKSDNVFILQTAERKLRMRAESALVMLTWANKLNELLRDANDNSAPAPERPTEVEAEEDEEQDGIGALKGSTAAPERPRARSVRKSVFLKKETLGKANGFTLSPIHDSTSSEPQAPPLDIFAKVPRRASLPPGDPRRMAYMNDATNEDAEGQNGAMVNQSDNGEVRLSLEDETRRSSNEDGRRSSFVGTPKIRSCCAVS